MKLPVSALTHFDSFQRIFAFQCRYLSLSNLQATLYLPAFSIAPLLVSILKNLAHRAYGQI